MREVRGDAGPWSTQTVVERHDGRTVLLPQGLQVATERQWQHAAFSAREHPEPAEASDRTVPLTHPGLGG